MLGKGRSKAAFGRNAVAGSGRTRPGCSTSCRGMRGPGASSVGTLRTRAGRGGVGASRRGASIVSAEMIWSFALAWNGAVAGITETEALSDSGERKARFSPGFFTMLTALALLGTEADPESECGRSRIRSGPGWSIAIPVRGSLYRLRMAACTFASPVPMAWFASLCTKSLTPSPFRGRPHGMFR
jgi:hypothetical protein